MTLGSGSVTFICEWCNPVLSSLCLYFFTVGIFEFGRIIFVLLLKWKQFRKNRSRWLWASARALSAAQLAGLTGQLCVPIRCLNCSVLQHSWLGTCPLPHGRAAASGDGTTPCLLAVSVGILGSGSYLASIFPWFGLVFFPHCNTGRRIFLISQTYIRQFDSEDLTSKINQNVMAVPTWDPRIGSDLKGKRNQQSQFCHNWN